MTPRPPPLLIATRPHPKAPAVRRVNPDAAAYLRRVGAGTLDRIYPADARALRHMAPSLTVSRPDGMQSLNPGAQTFAMSTALPFRAIYPFPPPLVRRNVIRRRHEMNPAAASYASATGKPITELYRSTRTRPPWHRRVLGSFVRFVTRRPA